MKTNFYPEWMMLIWRFEINFEKITIQFFEDFFNLDNKIFVYALMCNTFEVESTSKVRRLLELLKSYKNCFNFKNVKTFFKYKNKNHVIDLILDAKPSYESLYILFKIELDVLKIYLLKNLILNFIREFTSCANALMLFVFKKR